MKYLIILIHGTFAVQALWTLPGSGFRQKIAANLGTEPEFKTAEWSGRNNHHARIDAAKKLAIDLNSYLQQYPNHKKIIIAHSHGGNIALYALRQVKNAEEFDLVTMATPFLNPKLRDHKGILRYHSNITPITIGFLILFAGIAAFMGASFLAEKVFGHTTQAGDGIVLFVVAHCLFCMYVASKAYLFIKRYGEQLPERLEKIMPELSLGEGAPNRRLLAVIDYGDEVGIWFRNLYRVWESMLNLHELVIRISITFAQFLLFCFIAIIITTFFYRLSGYNMPDWISDYFSKGVMYCMLVSLLTFLIPPVFLLIRSNPIVLGWEPFTYQMFIQATPAIVPFRFSGISLLLYKVSMKRRFSLKHGIYEDDDVVADICAWIKSGG